MPPDRDDRDRLDTFSETLPLEGVSDEDLLAEVHRRFGDSWCSFSASVRSREECPVCKETQRLTRHHLVPIAQGAGHDREVRKRYVKLCESCHRLAHATWGPGDRYRGPQDRELLIKRLGEVRASARGT